MAQFFDRTPDNTAACDLGSAGEKLVAQWLQARGQQILFQQWSCRWGELDLIAGQPAMRDSEFSSIAFVEVKTRSQGNWDENGALAITRRKQAKLWKAAQRFLVQHPHLSELPCQFDVALVTGRRLSTGRSIPISASLLEADILIADGYQLTLQHYLPHAFTL